MSKLYLLQCTEIVKQEIRLKEDLFIDIEELVEKGSLILDERSWYNKLLFLGTEEGYPIPYFTNKDFLKDELNEPDERYLKMITKGLKETFGMTDLESGGNNKTPITTSVKEKKIN